MTKSTRHTSAAHQSSTSTPDDEAKQHTLAHLLEIMTALRDPDTGCPWDKEQTFETIAPYTIEEAYEVADAIHRNDLFDLRDELGDLLLQVVYHAEIAREQSAFDFHDVAHAISAKMLRRHPHVFGSAETRASVNRDGLWDRIKQQEKADAATERTAFYAGLPPGAQPDPKPETPSQHLSGVPQALPALTRAEKLQSKAAQVGFDWPDLSPVFDKLQEELDELRAAITTSIHSDVEDELGDVLFVIANIARHLKVDPEAALRRTNDKFVTRFAHIERKLAEQNRRLDNATLDEMEAFWVEAKTASAASKR